MPNKYNDRLYAIDALRGIAVLLVCWFHFTQSNSMFLAEDSLIKLSGKYGFVGVDIFFVISGFILTHVLLSVNYNSKLFHKFLLHRLIRLEPPYLASIIIILLLNYIASFWPQFNGLEPMSYISNIGYLFSHIGYLTGFLGFSWLNPVYWSLAIELQFYILIGVFFPLLINLRSQVPLTLFLLSFLSLLDIKEVWILEYLPIFILGMFAAMHYNNILKSPIFYILEIAVLSILVIDGEALSAIVALVSILCIYWKFLGSIKVLVNLGTISYSLYLLHWPIGSKVINLAQRMEYSNNLLFLIVVIFIALVSSLIAATLLYFFVEKPSIKWAKNISYRG